MKNILTKSFITCTLKCCLCDNILRGMSLTRSTHGGAVTFIAYTISVRNPEGEEPFEI